MEVYGLDNGRLGKPAIDRSIHEETAVDLKAKERNLDLHAPCLVNSCQGKDAVVLFRLNYSNHQHIGIGCEKFMIVGTFFFFC